MLYDIQFLYCNICVARYCELCKQHFDGNIDQVYMIIDKILITLISYHLLHTTVSHFPKLSFFQHVKSLHHNKIVAETDIWTDLDNIISDINQGNVIVSCTINHSHIQRTLLRTALHFFLITTHTIF